MKLTGTLLLPTPDGQSVRLAPGSLTIEGDRITEVNEDPSVTSGGPFICPAFTDIHLHLPQFDIIGAHGLTLLDWLNQVTFPAELRWADAAFAEAMTHRAIDQLLAVGTTGICAYATVHHDATMRAIYAAKQRRLRARIGQALMDRAAPDALLRPAAQLLDECAATLAVKDARVAAAVTPRFAVSCTEQLLRGAGRLAAEHDAFIQTHLAETVAECAYVRDCFGRDYVDVYAKTGLLGPKAIHGHGIHLTETDRRKLADTQTIIAHCPLANSFLMSGTMDRRALHHDRVRTGLGSDIGGGYERSMVRVARAMLEASAALHHEAIPAATAWWQITAGNADLAGWPNAGRLTSGGDADVLVIEPDIAWRDLVDPLSMLLFAWDDRWLKQTIAAGEVVYRG